MSSACDGAALIYSTVCTAHHPPVDQSICNYRWLQHGPNWMEVDFLGPCLAKSASLPLKPSLGQHSELQLATKGPALFFE